MNTRIYLDVDGICADFVGGVFRLYDLDPALGQYISSYDGIQRELKKYIDNPRHYAETIRMYGESFWAGLTVEPEAVLLIRRLQNYGHVSFLTKPMRQPSSSSGKATWLMKNFPDMAWSICGKKAIHAGPGAYLIDDDPKNVNSFSHNGGVGILWSKAWNRSDIVTPTPEGCPITACVREVNALQETRYKNLLDNLDL